MNEFTPEQIEQMRDALKNIDPFDTIAKTIVDSMIAEYHYICGDEPDWDGCCTCGSDEDNPCVCN